jgi:hypothetical protein
MTGVFVIRKKIIKIRPTQHDIPELKTIHISNALKLSGTFKCDAGF